jgi:hypothetical protein
VYAVYKEEITRTMLDDAGEVMTNALVLIWPYCTSLLTHPIVSGGHVRVVRQRTTKNQP